MPNNITLFSVLRPSKHQKSRNYSVWWVWSREASGGFQKLVEWTLPSSNLTFSIGDFFPLPTLNLCPLQKL